MNAFNEGDPGAGELGKSTTNRVSGHGADDYGVRHVEEIIADYTAQPFEPKEPLTIPRACVRRARSHSSPAESLLVEEGFFKSERTIGEVKDELANRGL